MCGDYSLLVDVSASIVWSGFHMVITEGFERFFGEGGCPPSEAYVFPPRSGELVCRGSQCGEVLVSFLKRVYGRGGRSGSPLGEAIRSVVGKGSGRFLLVVTDGRWNSNSEDSAEAVVREIGEVSRSKGVRVVLLLLGEPGLDYSSAILIRSLDFEPVFDVDDFVNTLHRFSISNK